MDGEILTIENAEHFFFNGLRLLPCKVVGATYYKKDKLGTAIKCYLSQYPITVDNKDIYKRSNLHVIYGKKNGWNVSFRKGKQL